MIKKHNYQRLFFVLVALFLTTCSQKQATVYLNYHTSLQRYWLGSEYWSNRLQDWQVNNGRLECLNIDRKLRTVHLLPLYLSGKAADFHMQVQTGTFDLQDTTLRVDHNDSYFTTPEALTGDKSYAGFIVGGGDIQTDYRARALTHRSFGKNGGVLAVVCNNELMFLDMEDSLKQLAGHKIKSNELMLTTQDIILDLKTEKKDTGFVMILSALKPDDKSLISSVSCKFDPTKTGGNVGIVANGSAGNERMYWFKNWKLSGEKFIQDDTQKFGPIVSAMYTIHKNILKLTAQLTPVGDDDPAEVMLEVKEKGSKVWEEIAQEKLIVPGYTATFRIENWNRGETRYRVKYVCPSNENIEKEYYYQGIIKANPETKDEIVVAAFTGNSPAISIYGDYDFSKARIWFPHNDLIPKVEKMNPDLLVYTGDQIYEWMPTQPDDSGNKSSNLDYLYKWYLWCWSHGDLARNIPTVCLLDDHDVFQGNLWGAGGRNAQVQEDGGYIMPPDFVNMAQRTQTSHLPDPYDSTPVKQGIEVYYCNLNWGNIDFAILEDRKFKSGPNTTLPADVLKKNSTTLNPEKLDVPNAILLGERQLGFIRDWAKNWENASMKATLSQTIFAGLFTNPIEKEKMIYDCNTYPKNHKIVFSPDANSWPLTPRNKALKQIRKGFAFMIAGDTHLGSIIHHGIDEWKDAGYSFCVPSIANRHIRVWYPPYSGENPLDSLAPYTGNYLDKAGAKITVYAASNPCDVRAEPSKLYDLAPGFGIIRFNKPAKTITMENWPRYTNPPNGKQFPGWPKTISMYDNYARKATGFLPEIKVKSIEKPPVIQVINETNNEVIYTVRMKDFTFQPKVFQKGFYTIKIEEPGTKYKKQIKHLSPGQSDKSLIIDFSD